MYRSISQSNGIRNKTFPHQRRGITETLTQGAAGCEGGGPGVRGVDVAVAGGRPVGPAQRTV